MGLGFFAVGILVARVVGGLSLLFTLGFGRVTVDDGFPVGGGTGFAGLFFEHGLGWVLRCCQSSYQDKFLHMLDIFIESNEIKLYSLN